MPVKGSAVTFDDKNTAHIYAQQASGNVGLNRFTDFNVDKGQTANLYFKTEGTNPTVVNTLVNTVQNQISISGVLAVKTGLGYLGICLSNPFAWGLAMFYCLFMVCRILRRETQTEA